MLNLQDDDQESIVLPDKNGQKFICYLPKVEKEKSGKPPIQQNVSSMIVETEKRVKQKTPDELLEVLKGPCVIRVSTCISVFALNDDMSIICLIFIQIVSSLMSLIVSNFLTLDNVFVQQEGWWSYEFCYHKKLRQLHLEDNKVFP